MNIPPKNCPLCPRLVAFREKNKEKFPDYYNGAVPPFSAANVKLLVVGLAPGLHGANNTGRPFTADYAGDLLYPTLIKYGFAKGEYRERADDGLQLIGARITNAVRCVPPENKPLPDEIKTCNQFLKTEIAALRNNLDVIVALGLVAHQAVLRALDLKVSAAKFAHGAEFEIPFSLEGEGARAERGRMRGLEKHSVPLLVSPSPGANAPPSPLRERENLVLLSSYHCSRYNTNTGRLTEKMFHDVFARARELCDK